MVINTVLIRLSAQGAYLIFGLPGRLFNFWTFRVGAYSRLGAY